MAKDLFTTEITPIEHRRSANRLDGGKFFKGFMRLVGGPAWRQTRADLAEAAAISQKGRSSEHSSGHFDAEPSVPHVITPATLDQYREEVNRQQEKV